MPLLKKLVFTFLVLVLLITYHVSLFSVPSAHAQTSSSPLPWYNQDIGNWYLKVYDSPTNDVFGERYTTAQVQWIFYGLFSNTLNAAAGLVGVTPKDVSCIIKGGSQVYRDIKNAPIVGGVIQKVLPKPADIAATLDTCGVDKILRNVGLISYNQQGTDSGIAEFIFLRDRPLSGISYFRGVARNWHIIPEAKAQATPGFGFSALDPILPLWKASRNVAYGLLVFAILIMSFMIMFRVKINPQTVITVQSAIPNVVLALILITFSYAIAGFMVDLMYVVIGLLSWVLSSAWSGTLVGNLFGGAATSPRVFFDFMTIGPGGANGSGLLNALGILLFPIILLMMLLLIVGGAAALTGVGTVPGLILVGFALVVLIAILIFFLKVVWMLFKAFAYVVLFVAFAPIQIALGIMAPSLGFGQWLKSLVSNLAVFPLAGLFLGLTYFFAYESIAVFVKGLGSSQSLGWPPLLSFGGGSAVGIVYFGVSIVIFASIPKIADIIKSVIEGKPFAYGTAIGEAVGPAIQPVRGLAGGAVVGYGRTMTSDVMKGVFEAVGKKISG